MSPVPGFRGGSIHILSHAANAGIDEFDLQRLSIDSRVGSAARMLLSMKATYPLTQTRDRASNRIMARGTASTTYSIRLAKHEDEIREAQMLRFLVFNVELGEGLEKSYQTLLDQDPFDEVCDHLIVEHVESSQIVGTYRLQTGTMAARNRGFYSDAEFDLSPFNSVRSKLVELGRACVHSQHRNMEVLGLLWNAIVGYSHQNNCRYLIGCSSIPTTDLAVGAEAFRIMSRKHLIEERFRTVPREEYRFELPRESSIPFKLPKLLRSYLAMGSRICGEPALDREFKTIDFLTFHDLQTHPVRKA